LTVERGLCNVAERRMEAVEALKTHVISTLTRILSKLFLIMFANVYSACYFVNYGKAGDYTATFRIGANDNDHNRIHSGCKVGGHSICTYMPISQK
jgi:hypothetical protein